MSKIDKRLSKFDGLLNAYTSSNSRNNLYKTK